MKPEKLIGRYARLNVDTMFGRKPGLLQITRVGHRKIHEKDFLCYAVELETGRDVGPFLRSECSVLRDQSPVSLESIDSRLRKDVVVKFAVRQ